MARPPSPFAAILGIGQLPSKARYDDVTYPELVSMVCQQALDDAGLDEEDLGGIVLGFAPDLLLGTAEGQYLAAYGFKRPELFLGRVHTAAGAGISAFRLGCAYACGAIRKPILVVAADLGSQATDHAKVIWQMLDPLRERQVPMNGVSLFACMASAYMHAYGVSERQLAMVTVKNRANGALNPFAQLRAPVTLDEVLASPLVAWPIRKLQVGPAGGGAAAVVVAPAHVTSARKSVSVVGLGACAGVYSIGDRVSAADPDMITVPALTKAANRAYRMAGIDKPETSIDVAEIYSSYPVIELACLEALGLSPVGRAAFDMESGRFERDGPLPVNASGGATCGNPLSATALLRVVEVVRLLRGGAGGHRARPPQVGLAAGFGGASQLHEVAILASAG